MEREKSKERDEERRENNKIPGNRAGARFYNQVPWMQLHLHAEMFVEAERAEALQQFYVFAFLFCVLFLKAPGPQQQLFIKIGTEI